MKWTDEEFIIQRGFIRWFGYAHPRVVIFHIPNEGKRSKIYGAKLKAAGLKPGMPDLCIPRWSLWIEVKSGRGKLSPDQEQAIAELRADGQAVYICHSIDDCMAAVEQHLAQIAEVLS